MKLVFIHGRDQREADLPALTGHWLDALNQGLRVGGMLLPSDLRIEFPFYTSVLNSYLCRLNVPLRGDYNIKGFGAVDRELLFQYRLLSELALKEGVLDQNIQINYREDVNEKGSLNLGWIKALLNALDRKGYSLMFIERFTQDVYVYLTQIHTARNSVDNIVVGAFEGDDEFVVVGHSLGSVVGYNVLRNLAADKKIYCYVTLGCPLGLSAINKKLELPIDWPSSVSSWYNAFDNRDLVAARPLEDHPFIFDPQIINNGNVTNDTNNRHGIYGYLSDPEVAITICNALNRQCPTAAIPK